MSVQIGVVTLTPDHVDAGSAALAGLFGAAPICAWLEHPLRSDGLCLRDNVTADEIAALFRDWPQGRLFNDHADLQWEQQLAAPTTGAGSQAEPLGQLYLPDPDDPAAGWNQHPRAMLYLVAIGDDLPALFLRPLADLTASGGQQHILLWGRRRQNRWYEERIPNLESIYIQSWSGPYAAIRVATYELAWDEEQTVRLITRYLGYTGNYQPHASTQPGVTEEERS